MNSQIFIESIRDKKNMRSSENNELCKSHFVQYKRILKFLFEKTLSLNLRIIEIFIRGIRFLTSDRKVVQTNEAAYSLQVTFVAGRVPSAD